MMEGSKIHEEEKMGLTSIDLKPMQISSSSGSDVFRNNKLHWCRRVDRRVRLVGVVLLVLGLITICIIALPPSSRSSKPDNTIILFECPAASFEPAANMNKDEFLESNPEKTNMLPATNMTEFLDTFREGNFDNWGKTYNEIKNATYAWKSQMFSNELNEGGSIYESACGTGLNLYMTLEILYEVKGLENIVVYGNEYLQTSSEMANLIFDQAAPFRAKKGGICAADSTRLGYVPPNAFDLVYTGYISPILNPIYLSGNRTSDNYILYRDLCEGNDWKSKKLNAIQQEMQEDFYAMWVEEMIRIAKPGKAVIIEQVSVPYCDNYYDWGGVSRDWWEPAVQKYHWDIDPKSIVWQNDTIFRDRYHVFMRKNNDTSWLQN